MPKASAKGYRLMSKDSSYLPLDGQGDGWDSGSSHQIAPPSAGRSDAFRDTSRPWCGTEVKK